VDDVLVLTDLQYKRDEFVDTLSRGMKQRLCLAKTLVHDPKVLLLDEPASGLDPRARIEMRELLKELKKMGKTILVSSHILTELQDFCDQIGIIEKGELLVSGNVEDIVEQIQGNSVYLIKVKDEWNRAKEILEKIQDVQRVTFIYESGKLVEGETPPELLSVELLEKSKDASLLLETLINNKISVLSCTEKQTDLEDIFMKITKGVVG
jgi:ABC-2 type transport system ATP-binding protein